MTALPTNPTEDEKSAKNPYFLVGVDDKPKRFSSSLSNTIDVLRGSLIKVWPRFQRAMQLLFFDLFRTIRIFIIRALRQTGILK